MNRSAKNGPCTFHDIYTHYGYGFRLIDCANSFPRIWISISALASPMIPETNANWELWLMPVKRYFGSVHRRMHKLKIPIDANKRWLGNYDEKQEKKAYLLFIVLFTILLKYLLSEYQATPHPCIMTSEKSNFHSRTKRDKLNFYVSPSPDFSNVLLKF